MKEFRGSFFFAKYTIDWIFHNIQFHFIESCFSQCKLKFNHIGEIMKNDFLSLFF